MLVAGPDGDELRYRGVVELGLARDELWEALAALEQPSCPLHWARPPSGVSWVAPELDVEVSCHGSRGLLRDATCLQAARGDAVRWRKQQEQRAVSRP